MDFAIIKLSIERLLEKIEALENQNVEFCKRIEELENRPSISPQNHEKESVQEDELLDTKQVLKMLGVCYNTLRKLTVKNLLLPIRISTKRVKYSKAEILRYVQSLSN